MALEPAGELNPDTGSAASANRWRCTNCNSRCEPHFCI